MSGWSKCDEMRELLKHLLKVPELQQGNGPIWIEHIKVTLSRPDAKHELTDDMIAQAYKSVYGSALGLEEDPLLLEFARTIANMLVPREPKQ